MPRYFFFDTSALAKRYHTEDGSLIIRQLFKALEAEASLCIAISSLIISETISVINRKHNRGDMTLETARAAQANLMRESHRMKMEPLDDFIVYQSMSHITRYNINSSDALFLYQAIRLQDILKWQDETSDVVFVSADKRLVRAARSEGLVVLNPETATIAEASVLLKE